MVRSLLDLGGRGRGDRVDRDLEDRAAAAAVDSGGDLGDLGCGVRLRGGKGSGVIVIERRLFCRRVFLLGGGDEGGEGGRLRGRGEEARPPPPRRRCCF